MLTHTSQPIPHEVQIEIVDLRGSGKSGRMPVTYQYLEPTHLYGKLKKGVDKSLNVPRQYAIIKIVAGPGISIALKGFGPPPHIPNRLVPLVEIIRVQDPELVPVIGSDINTNHLLGEYEVNRPALADLWPDPHRVFVPVNYFSVARMNNGVILRHHHTRQDLVITVPTSLGDPDFMGDPDSLPSDAKFAFQIHSQGRLNVYRNGGTLPLVEVVKTPSVKVEVHRQPYEYTLSSLAKGKGGTSASSNDIFYNIYEVDKIEHVPHQGGEFTPKPSWRLKKGMPPQQQPIVLSPAVTALDFAVRFTPFVGDLLDLAEFKQGYYEGRDLFGRKMSNTDVLLLGIGLFLPYSLGAAAKGVKALSKTYGRKARQAANLIKALKKAGVTKDDIKLVEEVTDLIIKGRHVPLERTKRFVEILRKMPEESKSIDNLLNADGTGFIHVDLQEGYRDYQKKTPKSKQLGPKDWAQHQSTGKWSKILEALLGKGFRKGRKGGPKRPVNAIEVPRPADYSQSEILSDLNKLLATDKTRERLQHVLPGLPRGLTTIEVDQLLPAGFRNSHIDRGLLNILKGNLAEVLAQPIKREILQKYPDAVLNSGLRFRHVENGKLVGNNLLFTDDIIARLGKGNKLEALAVFEIKSGYKGGQKATEQIFDWIEGRLTHAEGSELIIPRGATITKPDGRVITVKKEMRFTYKPGRRTKRWVIGLNNADRYIVTAAGTSHLGLNSAQQVAPKTFRRELTRPPNLSTIKEGTKILMPPEVIPLRGITSEQLDYLAVLILGHWGKL